MRKYRVCFRMFPDNTVIALFPDEIETRKGDILSYQHIGQHGQASAILKNELRKATPEEYKPLLSELRSIGYQLVLMR